MRKYLIKYRGKRTQKEMAKNIMLLNKLGVIGNKVKVVLEFLL